MSDETRATTDDHSAQSYGYISQLAAGPLGFVWAARVARGADEGRIVAVRRIQTRAGVRSAAGDIARAARAAMLLRHPNVSAVLDVVATENEVAVVTEYVEGEFLRSLQRRAGLRGEPIPESVALKLVLDLCETLKAIIPLWRDASSEPGLAGAPLPDAIFGGISPNSLLIASFGEPLVQDLGVSGIARRHPNILNHPEILPYCAPEQIEGGAVDERADIFSLGVLLWEMLANRPLFGSAKWTRYPPIDASTVSDEATAAALEDAALVRRKVLEAKVARLDAVVRAGSRIGSALADLVAKALARDVESRFQTLGELSRALGELGAGVCASRETVSEYVHRVAATSIEARRAALAALTGHSTNREQMDSMRPTLPPRPSDPRVEKEFLEQSNEDFSASTAPSSSPDPGNPTKSGKAARQKPPLPSRAAKPKR